MKLQHEFEVHQLTLRNRIGDKPTSIGFFTTREDAEDLRNALCEAEGARRGYYRNLYQIHTHAVLSLTDDAPASLEPISERALDAARKATGSAFAKPLIDFAELFEDD